MRIAAVVAGLVEGTEVDGGCYALAFLDIFGLFRRYHPIGWFIYKNIYAPFCLQMTDCMQRSIAILTDQSVFDLCGIAVASQQVCIVAITRPPILLLIIIIPHYHDHQDYHDNIVTIIIAIFIEMISVYH